MFEKMTGISEEYITEAALVPSAGASPARKPEGRFAALSRALNSGWGVACICLLLAIATVVSILHWGLPGASVNPFPPAVDPNAPRYVYSMGSLHSFSHGESVDRPVERGEDIYLTVSVQNNGPAFQIRDSEWAQLSAVCVLQGDDSVTLEWRYSPRDGGNQPYWVQTGATETLGFVLTIPENATPGVYDLVLSYDGVKQVFGGALTVGDPNAKFSFGYELAGDALTGASYLMDTWITNEGEPFTFEGSSMGFAPAAVLIHMETQYRIDGSFGVDDDQGIFTVKTGDVGRVTQEFFIPADAPTGAYALQLSYGGVSKSFPGAVIVAEPTDVDLDYPLPEDGHPFSFGYEPFGGFAIPGDWLTVKAWVINEGEPFSFFGDPNSFEPVATLHHVDSGYVIQGHSTPTGIPPRPCNILTGQKGESAYTFPIPADAPTGVYRLKLSYGGAQETFDNVLTVAVPTVPALGDMENPSFSFDYELLNSPDPAYAAWKAGDTIRIKVSVTNQGAPFTYTGSSGDFIPYPELYLKTVDNTRLTLHGTTPLPEDTGTFTVSTGQTGTAVYKFVLPDDIPAGYLEFAMSYAGKGTGKYSFGYISNASYTKEEAIAFATKQLSERHPELDLSQYVPRCVDSLGAGFDYKVQFQYQYYGYTVIGGKTVTVSLAADKKLLGIETEDEYAAYMEVLTENVFLAAIQNIRNSILEIDQAADPTEIMENLLSFQIDAEGYLCLTMEYIGPPRYDENGNNLSGCIDHEHYFFTERLCSKP